MKHGIGVSEGIARAPVVRMSAKALTIPTHTVTDPEAEAECFERTRQRVLARQRALYEKTRAELGEAQAEVFDAHCTILEDEESILNPILERIRSDGCNAAFAAAWQMDQLYKEFSSFEDDYMRERAEDLKDLREQLVTDLLGVACGPLTLSRRSILVADELSPSETMGLDTALVAGFLLRRGGATSHTAILARSLGVPAVVGTGAGADDCADGAELWLDGGSGAYGPAGDPETDAYFEKRLNQLQAQAQADEAYRRCSTQTKDGHPIALAANITSPEFLHLAAENDAEGIGLFRSEFLYLDQDELPDEETQFTAYRAALEQMAPHPVIIRTMDIGGDKGVHCLELPAEANPFLGYRAIRICLKQPELFRVQLRALLRASIYGKLSIMFPMISSCSEFRAAREQLLDVQKELASEGIPFDPEVKVGMMVEIPSAALMADQFARMADFFSIGTNDLTQYTLAVDRGNEMISGLYSALEPGVLRLVQMTAAAAAAHGIPCGMCGEAAADVRLVPLWLGMGLTELSVSPNAVLKTRRHIASLDYTDCQEAAEQAVHLADADAVESYLAARFGTT